jgi:hypothetical protein
VTDSRDEHEPYCFTQSPVIASIDLGDLVALQTKIVRLTAERDEARREIAHRVFVSGGLRPAELAESRGWDCFKEDGK